MHHLIHVPGLAIWRHSHDLVLALVHLKAEKGRKGAIEQADRVGEPHLRRQSDLVTLPDSPGCRRPLADPIDGQDRRLLEGGAEERAGGVGEVMLNEQDLPFGDPQLLPDQRLDPELLMEPGDHRLTEDLVGLRARLQDAHYQPLELQKRLLIEHGVLDLRGGDAGLCQAEIDSPVWKAVVVLAPGEPLLFGCRH